jgi:very-short-patch-repair endonuclease
VQQSASAESLTSDTCITLGADKNLAAKPDSYHYKYVSDRVLLPVSGVLDKQHGVLTREQAISGGLPRGLIASRLDSGRWQRLHRGVFATFSGPVPREAQLWGAVLRVGDHAVLSHHTAAELWRLADAVPGLIHLTVPRKAAASAIPGLALHFSARIAEARHPARIPPQTKLEETVLDLADLERTAENAVAWPIRACQRRLTTPDRIIAALENRTRARWRRDVADAIPDIQAGVHSPLELRYVRNVERRHGLPRGERQARVIRGMSRQYIDVLYPEQGVVVELDGVLAHSADASVRDARRDNANTLDGYQTLRYGWTSVAYHACATALEVFSLLQRNGLATPFRPCGKDCAAMPPGTAGRRPAWTPPARQPAR